jgi:hypothetical protein
MERQQHAGRVLLLLLLLAIGQLGSAVQVQSSAYIYFFSILYINQSHALALIFSTVCSMITEILAHNSTWALYLGLGTRS